MSESKLTANKVLDLLKEKHKSDIIVSECKMGSAHSKRLDAWVLKKTWSPKTTIGYEIKVSRSDFLQDDKWKEYLATCHQFYFVCPWGLIQKEELPQGVGLMWSSKNGSKLYTKRKAVHKKDKDLDTDLLFYILMHRVKITNSTFGRMQHTTDPKKYWEMWLKNKELDREFGRMVGAAINKTIKEEIESVSRENSTLRRENERLRPVKEDIEKLEEAGIDRWMIRKVLNEGLGEAIKLKLISLRRDMEQMQRSIKQLDRDINDHVEGLNEMSSKEIQNKLESIQKFANL